MAEIPVLLQVRFPHRRPLDGRRFFVGEAPLIWRLSARSGWHCGQTMGYSVAGDMSVLFFNAAMLPGMTMDSSSSAFAPGLVAAQTTRG